MHLKEYIALDLGTKYTGIARGSNLAKIAEPLISLKTDTLIAHLKKIIKDNDVSAVVVGLPRNLSGNDTDQTRWVRQWVNEAKKDFKVPFFWQDEALTSVNARGNPKADEHSMAAAMILQDFLNANDQERHPA